ncbi:MAG: hypothetical protein AB1644_13880 [Candidatus Zixiibacteriota bacterium]
MAKQILMLLLVMALAGGNRAGEGTIEQVMPVAPVDGGMWDGEFWSPSGTKIVFFSGGQLTICDTLGRSRSVAKVNLLPRGLVWSSEDELLVYLRDYGNGDTVSHRLTAINVTSGEMRVVEQYRYSKQQKSSEAQRTFRGPMKSVEGVAYYYRVNSGAQNAILWPPNSKMQLGQVHELRTGKDGLYLAALDASDSSMISHKPYKPYLTLPLRLSPDRSHIMFGGTIVRLADDRLIVLDTLSQLKPFPPGTQGCGFGSESFSPVGPEVIFRLTCDNGHDYALDRLGIFNYLTFQLSLLDTTLTTSAPFEPAFSPDGRRISFVARGVLYLAVRRQL